MAHIPPRQDAGWTRLPPPWHPDDGCSHERPPYHRGATMDSFTLGFDATFSELSGREGLVRLDRVFVNRLAAADADLHARLMTARATPEALDAKTEGELVVALGPHLEDFLGELFAIQRGTRCGRRAHPGAGPGACLQAAIRAAPGREEICRSRRFRRRRTARRARSADGAGPDRGRFRHPSRRMGGSGGCGGSGRGAALRRLGDADRGGKGASCRRHAVPGAAPHRSGASGPGGDDRARRRDHAAPARA